MGVAELFFYLVTHVATEAEATNVIIGIACKKPSSAFTEDLLSSKEHKNEEVVREHKNWSVDLLSSREELIRTGMHGSGMSVSVQLVDSADPGASFKLQLASAESNERVK